MGFTCTEIFCFDKLILGRKGILNLNVREKVVFIILHIIFYTYEKYMVTFFFDLFISTFYATLKF